MSPRGWCVSKRARQYALPAIACGAFLGTFCLYYGRSPSSSDAIRRKLAEEIWLPAAGAELLKANATAAPVAGLRIASGGELWPAFSAETADYRVRFQPQWHGDALGVTAPEVELEVELNEQSLDHRLFVNGVEVQQQGADSSSNRRSGPQLCRHRLVLAHLARRSADGSPLYPYEAVELEVRGPTTRRQYWLRFLQPPQPRSSETRAGGTLAEAKDRRLVNTERLQTAATKEGTAIAIVGASSSHAPSGQYAVLDLHSKRVAFELAGGSCRRVPGPLEGERTQVPEYAKKLGLWSSDTQHVFCFASDLSKQSGGGEDEDVHFAAWGMSSHGQDESNGKFGFGDGMKVSLRPNIETEATWPLESGVRSVGLDLTEDQVFLAAAVRGELAGESEIEDIPMVATRASTSRHLEVQLLNESLGHCSLEDIGSTEPVVVCRTAEGLLDGHPVELLALCGACIERGNEDWKIQVEEQGSYPVPSAAPWVAWHASAPKEEHISEWSVALQGAPESKVVQVYLIHGSDSIDWMAEKFAKEEVRMAGETLKMLVLLLALSTGVMLLFAIVGVRPVPVVGVLPSVASALSALQFLVLVGSRPGAPVLFRGLCEPFAHFIQPMSAAGQLQLSLGVLLVCVLAHAWVVGKHLMVNGSGSANALPHGLQFGAWELRFLGFVALPLTAGSCSMIANGYSSVRALYDGEYSMSVIHDMGFAVLALLLYCTVLVLGNVTRIRITTWISDQQVIGMVLPAARDGFVFVDRVCTQLRTMPMTVGRTKLLGNWSTSPGWCVAGSVASIHDMEHAGTPDGEDKAQPWEQVWPSGPWSSQEGNDVGAIGMVGRNSSAGPSSLGMSRSAVRHVNHVRASTKFVYKAGNKNLIAGLTNLTWLDVAVPASDLKTLETRLGAVALRAHPGQLSGPLTDGRLAACFDWGTRWPWRWSQDILLKAFLGAYVAFGMNVAEWLRVGVSYLPLPFNLSVPEFLRFSVAIGLIALACAVFVKRPYVHILDNAALAGAIAVVAAGDLLCILDDDAAGLPRELFLALAVLSAIPLGIALCATMLASWLALKCHVMDMHQHILPRCVVGWAKAGEQSPRSPVQAAPAGYEGAATVVANTIKRRPNRFKDYGLLEDEEALEGEEICGPSQQDRDDAVARGPGAGFRKVNVRVTDMVSAGSTSPSLNLPAKALMAITRTRVQKPQFPGDEARHLPETTDFPTVPLALSQLFSEGAQPIVGANPSTDSVFSTFGVETTPPIAVLLTAEGGRLIYLDAKDNCGIRWQDASRSFFGPEEEALAGEVEKIIETYFLMRNEFPLESAIVVIEILDE